MKDPDGTISRMASSNVRLKSGIEAAKGQNELSTANRIVRQALISMHEDAP